MNAPVAQAETLVKFADLSDAQTALRLDRYVQAFVGSSPFHLIAWQKAIRDGCGHRCHYLYVEDAGGKIAGVLPLTEVHSRLFGRALVASGFAVGGGVLADSIFVEQALLAEAIALGRRLNIPGIELRGGSLPPGWQVDADTYLGFSRPLARSDDEELTAIPRKQRAEVRKALGFELETRIGTSSKDLDDHFAVYAESVRNLGTPVFPRALFRAVLAHFGDSADILTVSQEGRPITSVLSLYHQGVVMPYWGGGTADARTWRANDLMYYALMCHARTAKASHSFDFGRSKAGTGPAAFKKNWGFEGQPLSYAKWTASGAVAREINPMSPKYQMQVAVWKKLPLWLANQIGPFIARGLG